MEYCMGKTAEGFGCGAYATRFEADDDYHHDWLWCDEHAEGRPTEPFMQAPKGRREESDE